jgi:hypothetical protein
MSVREAVDSITTAVHNWSPAQNDDITLLLCEFAG